MSATGIKQINADFGIFYGNVTCLSDINVSGLSVFNNLINGATSANLNALSTYSNLNIENLKLTSTTIFNNLNTFSTNTILLINNKTNFNNLYITGASTFINTLNISGLTVINGSTTFYNNLNVSGLTLINGSTSFLNSINISGITNINGSTTFYNNLNVSGVTLINGSTSFLNRINISGITNINGSTTIFNTLNVSGVTLINGASTFISNLNINGNLGLGMNSNQKLSVNGIGEFVNGNTTKIILSTDVSNNSRHSISSNHDAGVGNNNYIDLNVWDNSLAATTLGTYNAARFHRNFTQFGGNRYVYINDVIIDRNVYNHIFTPLNVFHQTPVSTSVLNDNLPILTLARQGTGGQSFGTRATFKISRWENNSTNSRTKLNLDLSHSSYDDINVLSIRSDGNVGIGKDNPTQILQVGNAGRLRISNGISDYSILGTIDTDGATNTRIVISGRDRGGVNANGNIEYVSTGTAGQHIFYTTDSTTERFKIYNSGGVNVTGNYYKNGAIFIPDNAYNLTGSPNITVGTIRASGTIASVNGAPWDHLRFYHDGATAYFDAGGAESGIAFRIDNTASGYPAPSYPERMRITASGDVGVGNSAPVNVGGNFYNLHIGRCGGGAYSRGYLSIGQDFNNGSVRQFRLGYNDSFDFTIGDWGGSNANNTWTQQIRMSYASPFDAIVITSIGFVTMRYGYSTSDQRIKTNIKTINNALWKVQQLRGIEYNDIKLGSRHIGLIAQEVEHIIPEVVTTNENDDLKSVAYGNLVGLLIEAIKEQQEEINSIKNILKNNNLI